MSATKKVPFLSVVSGQENPVIFGTNGRVGAILQGEMPTMGQHAVYTLSVGNAVYVGRTAQLYTRLRNHLCKRYWANHSTLKVYAHFLKTQPQTITVAVSVFNTAEAAKEAELFMIDFYRQQPDTLVLNIRRGAEPTASEKAISKWSHMASRGNRKIYRGEVLAMNLSNGLEIHCQNQAEASRMTGALPTNISGCIKGRLKSTNGFTFKKINKGSSDV